MLIEKYSAPLHCKGCIVKKNSSLEIFSWSMSKVLIIETTYKRTSIILSTSYKKLKQVYPQKGFQNVSSFAERLKWFCFGRHDYVKVVQLILVWPITLYWKWWGNRGERCKVSRTGGGFRSVAGTGAQDRDDRYSDCGSVVHLRRSESMACTSPTPSPRDARVSQEETRRSLRTLADDVWEW